MTDPDQLPALPQKRRGFICTKCGSSACRPDTIHREHPECDVCGYCGFAQDLDYNDVELRAYALTAIATERARADALQAELASLADTVAEAVRNTCSMPHPDIGLSTDLKPHIWSLSYEANNQQRRADALEAALKPLAALGLWALDETRGDHIGSDLSGGDIQDKAEALGLLARVEVKEPCSEEYCSCAEYYDKDEWPVQCLQNSPLIATARALLEKKT